VPGTRVAPHGTVWVCGACGKRSLTRYGFDEENKRTALDNGWDESCMLNATLCKLDSIVVVDGRVSFATAVDKFDEAVEA
jgi:hypothetical protein